MNGSRERRRFGVLFQTLFRGVLSGGGAIAQRQPCGM